MGWSRSCLPMMLQFLIWKNATSFFYLVSCVNTNENEEIFKTNKRKRKKTWVRGILIKSFSWFLVKFDFKRSLITLVVFCGDAIRKITNICPFVSSILIWTFFSTFFEYFWNTQRLPKLSFKSRLINLTFPI